MENEEGKYSYPQNSLNLHFYENLLARQINKEQKAAAKIFNYFIRGLRK